MTRRLRESPSQTAGPYVHIGCTPRFSGLTMPTSDLGAAMIVGEPFGQVITVTGVIFDGSQAPICDAMVEVWQADAKGRFAGTDDDADPAFAGWGRTAVDQATGQFVFETVKPGSVAWHDGRLQAPHITLWIVARGINVGLQTRIYFEDEAAQNDVDPILSSLPVKAKETLLARKRSEHAYEFNIFLQGDNETAFFDI